MCFVFNFLLLLNFDLTNFYYWQSLFLNQTSTFINLKIIKYAQIHILINQSNSHHIIL